MTSLLIDIVFIAVVLLMAWFLQRMAIRDRKEWEKEKRENYHHATKTE